MVFRRENKVDSFQRQMSALRQQLGNQPESELDDLDRDMPELEEEQFDPQSNYQASSPSDSEGYSFGSFPQQESSSVVSPDEIAAPEMPEVPNVDSQISVVAAGAIWKGDVESEASIHVHGRIEGTLTAAEDVWIAQGAEVEATITARRVIIAGTVSGTVNARERFEALPQGQISAAVHAPTFVVHEGATINGQLHMRAEQTAGETRGDRTSASAIIQRRTRQGA